MSIALLICAKQVEAQTNVYHPFPDTSAKWNEMYWSLYSGTPPCDITCPNIVFLAGDTIISTLHYKKLLSSGYCYCGGPPTCCYYYNTYQGAIRQDTIHKKVYYRTNSSTSVDTLLYTFNLYVGDTLPPSYINPFHTNYVSSIDSILIGTSYRKRYHISIIGSTSLSGDSNYVSLIEGIGSTFGLTYPITGPPFENGYNLYCFSQNNITLYPNTTDSCYLTLGIKEQKESALTFNIYPNPTQGMLNVKLGMLNENTNLQVTDMLGNTVKQFIIHNTPFQISIADLSEGVYTISISSKEGVVNKKFVIVK
ncbi:MAG: T9SS type A sorting domain-containing protein [Bacteroidia bacterium]